MTIKEAYKIEKVISKLHIHSLDMVAWHGLRLYLNRTLPKKYAKKKNRVKQIPATFFTKQEVIVSMTSYPKRMASLPLVLETLFNQTVMPTRIILWLAEKQYSDKSIVDIQLQKYLENGLEIRYCDDLRAHKKYYYAMAENPNALVITVDDDILYQEDMVETLLKKHLEYPSCIVTCRAHDMRFVNNNPAPYNSWNMLAKGCIGPSLTLCATGGAGCLYPPGSLSEHVFDKEVFMDICQYADDLWMKCMSYIEGTSIVLTNKDNPEIITVISVDDAGGLASYNVLKSMNDVQLAAITDKYNIKWPE